ncbi:methyltransferase, TIGR04325 family [Mucilaginibacter sp. UYCu711]|uniref:methyltransferase, TIGR04325 family n=1 Tax=Mucilaginibacter sp. UYCu711 TaxID=3156339 RepID=UPI003D1C6226
MYYLIKEMVPSIFHTLKWYSFKYGWKGDYKTYEDAKAQCAGYDEDHILQRIIDTTNKVKNGEAVYERDGIIYDEIKENFHLLSTLLLIAGKNNNKLTFIDFGGSLGTSYYQNISYLSHLTQLNWCIIEQPKFVDAGKKAFENEHVKFYNSLEDCLAVHPHPDLVLFSSSLQYMSDPYKVLKVIQSFKIPYILIDLIGYNDKKQDRITIQHVPPVFYGIEASYPCMFINRDKLEAQLSEVYNRVFDFIVESEKYYIGLKPFKYEGSLWHIKTLTDTNVQ